MSHIQEVSPLSQSGTARRVSRRVAVLALVPMLAVYFFSYVQRSAIPGTIFNEIQADMALPASAVAALGTLMTYVYGGMQVVVGVAADRHGGRRCFLLGAVILVVGGLLFPLSQSLPAMYSTRLLTAFGASFLFLSLAKELDILFGKRHFVALLGVVTSVGYLGAIAGTLPFQRAVACWGWRDAALGLGALTGVFLLPAFFVLRGPYPFRPPRKFLVVAGVWEVLCNRRTLPLIICGLINFPVYFVFQSVLGKKFLEDVAGLSPAAASTFVMLMVVVSAVTSFMGGISLRWIGHRRKPAAITAAGLVIGGATIMLLSVLGQASSWAFLLGYLALACSTGCGSAAVALMKEHNRPEVMGVAISILNGTSYIGAGIVGTIAGFVLDAFAAQATVREGQTIYPSAAYATLFAVLVGLGLLSLVSVCFVRETRGESCYEPPLD